MSFLSTETYDSHVTSKRQSREYLYHIPVAVESALGQRPDQAIEIKASEDAGLGIAERFVCHSIHDRCKVSIGVVAVVGLNEESHNSQRARVLQMLNDAQRQGQGETGM